MGKAIEHVPGKDETCLLLEFEDNCHLYLGGDGDKPIAYIEASIFGNEAHRGYDALTADIARAFNKVLGIDPERIYIRFDDIVDWSVAGVNIDRRRYR